MPRDRFAHPGRRARQACYDRLTSGPSRWGVKKPGPLLKPMKGNAPMASIKGAATRSSRRAKITLAPVPWKDTE